MTVFLLSTCVDDFMLYKLYVTGLNYMYNTHWTMFYKMIKGKFNFFLDEIQNTVPGLRLFCGPLTNWKHMGTINVKAIVLRNMDKTSGVQIDAKVK